GVNQFNSLMPSIAHAAARRGFIEPQEPGRESLPADQEKIRELFWSFIIQGIIMPGFNTANPNLPFFTLTEYGRRVVASEDPVPHDPDQYLEHLRDLAPSMDSIAVSYVEEGLVCFQRGTYTASVVMLGVACEKLTLDLAETVQLALPKSEAERLKKVIEEPGIVKIYEETMKRLRPRIGQLPKPLKDSLEDQLNGIFAVIRTHRNLAGHPTGEIIDRLTALGLFSVFPFYCKRSSDLIDYIKDKGLPV
ncbi:hypothetical protein ACFLXE_02870, partial [Chloroflexota bacterium]